jgi:hypothetical protein
LIAACGFTDLIELGVVDVPQPAIAHVGGTTALRKVAAMADAAGMRMAPHVRRPDRRHGQPARRCGPSQFPLPGNLPGRAIERDQ